MAEERAYSGKILNVDLNAGEAAAEELPDQMYKDYLGGYGIGARILFDRIPKGADPMGPDNVLGLVPGLMTGTPIYGNRFQAVCKSPLTGGWGDANCGGDFGPYLKSAGWDGVFFSGISDKPVYILIDDDKVTIEDAADYWGMGAIEVEDKFKEVYGKKTSVACIGPAGESLSLLAGICNEHGRLAARSGVGAVMGSKRVKAVVVKSSRSMIFQHDKEIRELVKASTGEFVAPLRDFFRTFGTTGITAGSALSGDAPIQNWGGVGQEVFTDLDGIQGPVVNEKMDKHYACWHCPLACGAESVESTDSKYPYPRHTHRPEYETMGAFGTMTLSANLDMLIYANHLCNEYGLDTIGAGGAISFAIECFENGLITKEDTDGLELNWANDDAIIGLLHKMGKREGFGDVIADGVAKAAEKLGKESEAYAVHVGGQELPMHDPKLQPEYYTTYRMDATPARHTQYEGNSRFGGPEYPAAPSDSKDYANRGEHHKGASEYMHVQNATGMCMFIGMMAPTERYPEWINAVTGWNMTGDELQVSGERIANLRMAFGLREGDNPKERFVSDRIWGGGDTQQKTGPLAGVTLDIETLENDFLKACDWDLQSCAPSRGKLESLGLRDVADVLGV
jgi:aldehyde:ferredoxin oxidoreductase